MIKWLKIRVIGSGSHGTVYQAITSKPEKDYPKPIAIKSAMLSKSYSLQREERILKSFSFVPEIIQSHGSDITMEDGEWIYNLHLEYAPFGTLADMIKKRHFLENRATKAYISMLLRGLSCIHQKGFVHCDLKPENILIFPPRWNEDSRYCQLKIADFGLTKTSEENVNQEYWKWRFRRTPLFMSPESLSCGHIEAPLDIWSFGCIVLEMLTGFPAWRNEIKTEHDIMIKVGIMKEAPKIPPGLSNGCINFLNKCFAPDPSQRWTADELMCHPFLM